MMRHGSDSGILGVSAGGAWNRILLAALLLTGGGCAETWAQGAAPAAEPKLDRTVLPIQMPARPTYAELDAHNVKTPAWLDVHAPAGAPNVVIVLIDDMGFGVPSTFGGPVPMPTMDRVAREGLRYNNFHSLPTSQQPQAFLAQLRKKAAAIGS